MPSDEVKAQQELYEKNKRKYQAFRATQPGLSPLTPGAEVAGKAMGNFERLQRDLMAGGGADALAGTKYGGGEQGAKNLAARDNELMSAYGTEPMQALGDEGAILKELYRLLALEPVKPGGIGENVRG